MSTTVLTALLGVASALGWGSADFCGGLASRRATVYSVLLVSELTGLIVLLPLPFLFHESLPGRDVFLMSSLAGLGGTIGLMLLYRALAEGQMSIAAPVSGLVAAVIPVTVSTFRDGLPGPITLLGFGLALVAIWLISVGGKSIQMLGADLRALLLPFLAGFTFGAYFLFTNLASQHATYWPLVFSRTLSTLILLLYLGIKREPLRITSAPIRQAALGGLLDVLANFFYVLTGQLGRLDVAAVLGSLYPGTTVLLAWLVLKERLNRTQGIGILAALTAIALIAA